MAENSKLNNLQTLRAVACLFVVVFHLSGALSSYGYQNWINSYFLKLGASGVDLFFVISGFVMVYIQVHRKTSPLRFLRNRLLRIAPLYWVLTLTMALVLLLLPGMFRTNEFELDRFVASMLLACGLFLQKETLVFTGWTIEYEFVFYSIFFISLYARKLWLSIAISSLIISACVAFGYIGSIALEFIFGMVIAAIFFVRSFHPRVYLGSLLLGSIFVLLTGLINVGSIDRSIVWGIPSALIVFGAAGVRQSGSNVMTVIGDGSYSIYLAQAFLIPVFAKLQARFWEGAPYLVLIIGGSLFVTLLGYACFQIVEKNLLRLSSKVTAR
jgi:exopolysaccharide production protein ExoZ